MQSEVKTNYHVDFQLTYNLQKESREGKISSHCMREVPLLEAQR